MNALAFLLTAAMALDHTGGQFVWDDELDKQAIHEASPEYAFWLLPIDTIVTANTGPAFYTYEINSDADKEDGIDFTERGDRIHGVWGITGDSTIDGAVNVKDLNNLALNWRRTDAQWRESDFNQDGIVDAKDLNILALNWQEVVWQTKTPEILTIDFMRTVSGWSDPEDNGYVSEWTAFRNGEYIEFDAPVFYWRDSSPVAVPEPSQGVVFLLFVAFVLFVIFQE